MAGSTVNLRGIVSNAGFQMPTPKVQSTGNGVDFSQVLENATGGESMQEQNVDVTKDNCQVERKSPVEETQDAEQTAGGEQKKEPQGVTESQKPEHVEVSEDDVEAAMEVIATAILEIQELFCETLGITKDELSQALDVLGMTEIDLLAAGNASKLTLYMKGESEMALLTNEDLYNTVQSLEGELQQISRDLMQKNLQEEMSSWQR